MDNCTCILGPESKIVAGIAGSAIEENRAPGHWNNSVGYHSNTGRCYSSHDSTANTGGEVIGLGESKTQNLLSVQSLLGFFVLLPLSQNLFISLTFFSKLRLISLVFSKCAEKI